MDAVLKRSLEEAVQALGENAQSVLLSYYSSPPHAETTLLEIFVNWCSLASSTSSFVLSESEIWETSN